MSLYTVTHFRSEFIQQGQATILRKVTMTQFMLVIVCTALGIGLFGAPYWLAPLFIALGYTAGVTWHGEILLRRALAYTQVWLRLLLGTQRIVNLQQEWDSARAAAERQQLGGLFPATVVVEPPVGT